MSIIKEQKLIPVVKGFKATNKDMQCRDFQFKMDEVFEHKGELKMCESGFHFCVHPSGVWSFYNSPEIRIFEIEAYDVLAQREGYGAEVKMVAKRIKFIREIKIGGYYNTGDKNTGDRNTGDRNTGDYNTGYGNTTNYSSGFFNSKESKVIVFDTQTTLTRQKFMDKYPEFYDLSDDLLEDNPIDFEKYKNIPGITKRKLNALHKKFKESRKNN